MTHVRMSPETKKKFDFEFKHQDKFKTHDDFEKHLLSLLGTPEDRVARHFERVKAELIIIYKGDLDKAHISDKLMFLLIHTLKHPDKYDKINDMLADMMIEVNK